MSLYLKDLVIMEHRDELKSLPEGKLLINTINAHSYNVAQTDALFAEALVNGDVLIADGISIVWACRYFLHTKSKPRVRCAGWDLFMHEMQALNLKGKARFDGKAPDQLPADASLPVVLFLGSSEHVLSLIHQRAAKLFPYLKIVTYSPPYKPEFTEDDDRAMVQFINQTNPDLLWIGMTAPKQEKWAYSHWKEFDIHCHVGTVGAVFDFFAGTYKRAPEWWQDHGLEWLFRLMREPRRMYRRYLIGNPLFLWNMFKERCSLL